MKRMILMLIVSLLIGTAGAQDVFEELVEKYADVEGFSAVQLTSDMFELYLKKKNIDEDDPVFETLQNLDNIMVITQTAIDEDDDANDNLKDEIIQHYKDNSYNLFKTEKNTGSDLKIYIQKNEGGVESMGLVTSNSFSVNLIEMNGDIDLGSIANLNKALSIRGLEELRVFDNESPTNFFFNYNLPRSSGWDVPDMSKMDFEFDDEKIHEMEEKMKEHQEQLEETHRERMEQSERMRERSKELYKKYKRFPIMISGSDSKNAEYYIDGEKVDMDEIKELDDDQVETIQVVRKEKDGKTESEIRISLKKDK